MQAAATQHTTEADKQTEQAPARQKGGEETKGRKRRGRQRTPAESLRLGGVWCARVSHFGEDRRRAPGPLLDAATNLSWLPSGVSLRTATSSQSCRPRDCCPSMPATAGWRPPSTVVLVSGIAALGVWAAASVSVVGGWVGLGAMATDRPTFPASAQDDLLRQPPHAQLPSRRAFAAHCGCPGSWLQVAFAAASFPQAGQRDGMNDRSND